MNPYLQDRSQILTKTEKQACKPYFYLSQSFQSNLTETLFDCSQHLEAYACSFCGISTHLLVELQRHIQVFHKVHSDLKVRFQPYHCRNCDFLTFSFLLWLKHRYQKCFINECNKCGEHLKKRRQRKSIQCKQCSYETKSNHVLEAHILSKHTSPEQIQWFECQLCSYRGRHKDYLRKHMVSMHRVSSEDSFECNQCLFKAPSKYCLKSHKLEEHSLQKNYKCKLCEFSARWKVHLRRHEAEIHAAPEEIQWFECGQCEFKAKRKDNLKQHIQARHAEVAEWFECEQCGFRTKWKKNMKLHKEKSRHV